MLSAARTRPVGTLEELLTVLVVDDVAINRTVLRATLESDGHAVFEAADGVEALAQLEQNPVNAVISDILMPNMDGYRLCQEIRKRERFRELPFIFYSGTYDSPADEKLSLEIGGDLFLGKPAEVPALLDALKKVTSARRSAQRSAPTLLEELSLMKQYSSVLVDKLEEKNTELHQRTLDLERELAERKLQQERIGRLSRMRSVVSSINALIVRTRSRAELFQEACRIAVEQGGFGLAWIGVVQSGQELVPIATHGSDDGHMDDLKFLLDGGDTGACAPTVQAIRENRPRICNDVANDPLIGPWREPLRALGYGSFVAYPLTAGKQAVGCFNLYAAAPGFFDEEEMKLLAELAGDISYALEFIIKDEQLDFLSIYDPLTRLPNRNLFMRRLPAFIQAAQDSGKRLALLMLDVERFKAINDAAGQAGGDELLKRVGERVKFNAGGPSFTARIAGDRFAALIPDIDRAADVETLVQNGGWDRLDPPFQHGGQEFAVTFKIGLAVFPQDAGDAEALLRKAELALKHGKSAGGRLTRYTADMGDVALRKLQLDRQLRHALERDEFKLHYQPKVDLRTGLVCGAEALLRWNSPDRGLVLPASFVPLMEETGLILDVGRWVIERAVSQREQWSGEGLAVPRIGVNVSAVQLREADFVESVQALLSRAQAAGGIELEVTESMMMTDPNASVATLRTLRSLGLTIAMDDYGTGYSSLAYLNRLPLNSVKIDRSFIITMVSNPDTMSIVSSIIALAHSMNLKVVAEGVDAEDQLQYLRLLRCDEIQGFLFSQPLPAAEFAALLRSGKKLA